MQPILKERLILASPQAVWAALTDPASIQAWMGDESAVEFDLRPGGRFRLFGGETSGTIETVEPLSRLGYSWRQAEWPAEWADSHVEWTLSPEGPGTRLHLVHRDFPTQQERDGHDQGWDDYFLGPMQQVLEERAG
jgi:uncharacterized protein YndB with AHSA1/START domain